VVLEHATRRFSIRADNAGTLKGRLLGPRRARAGGPAPVPALDDVSLRIDPGETVGMVGRNGAGKTSTLRALAGIVPLQSGSARCGGRVVSLLELAAGFSRDFSGRENILLQGALFGFDRPQIEARVEQIIAFSELGQFIDAPVKTYSQGMFLRLGFSIAAHLDADVLLIDEVLAVGDEGFQRKCLRRISEQIARGATLLLVSHELGAIERVCERVVVIDHGRVVFDGPTTEGLAAYRALIGTEHGGGESVRPHRAGDGAEVTDLELLDAAGRACSVFHSGGRLTVSVAVRVPRTPAPPRLRLSLRGAGAELFAAETGLAPLADGTATVAFEVPDLALLGGDYDIAVGAGEAGSPIALERSVRFAVARDPDAPAGMIDLRGQWRTVERIR
jgi:ABC-type polysaccharide/polyol phosphate transport system ATPase subunit